MTVEGTPSVAVPLSTINCEETVCPVSCESVFDMVHVSYLIRGGTRVMWQLLETFVDPLPWLFQLQFGHTGVTDADDWEDVGVAAENACYAIDSVKRVYSYNQSAYYRLKLTTPIAVYYSQPTACLGVLNKRDWRIAQEIVRKERLRSRYNSQDGYLLKKRITGEDCKTCLDLQTNEVTDPFCPECRGTGKSCGYYYPMACVWADIDPKAYHTDIDGQGQRGVTRDIKVKARMLMLPIMNDGDIWVSRKTDTRYYIHSIQHVAELRGVPLIANAEMRPAPYTDVAYDIEIPQQDQWLTGTC